ncbi:MAG TPA: FG-GAP-like repeat-containing protein [Pyrinomonadaceae bacterium]|nr:FG-GAP-like repeat-containing protein [Pyrinomonadaceae bacterium]
MNKRPYSAAAFVITVALALISAFAPRGAFRTAAQGGKSGAQSREEAYRANNLGVALLEQFKHREGAEQFRRALSIDPKLTLARINLSIALLNVPDFAGALKEAQAAAAAAPNAPQPHYVLGMVARQQGRVEDAVASFQRVLKIDPLDVGANVQLGQLYAQQRMYAEAVAAFRAAVAEEPYNGTALYNLGTALLRMGRREEGQRIVQQFQALRQSGAATIIGQNYMEQGRYAEAVTSTGAEPDLVDKATPEVSFVEATEALTPPAGTVAGATLSPYVGGAVTLFDFDSDGDPDIFGAFSTERKLYRNDGGKFADVTAQSGLAAKSGAWASAAVAGDFDNDEKPDLLVAGAGALALYRNAGGGRFDDATSAARLPAYTHLSGAAAFVDVDHDGDLDIFVGGSRAASATTAKATATPNLLLRNNGDGTFADVTSAAKLSPDSGAVVAVVPTDYDNRRDVDLLVAAGDGSVALWKNLRDGTFREVAAEVGLPAKGAPLGAVAAGDVNKDGFTDFYFGREGGVGDLALSDGRGRFKIAAAPSGGAKPVAAQFLDYDNDGLLDILTVEGGAGTLRVLRNTGQAWADVSEKAAGKVRLSGWLASGDLDGDGDVDLVSVPAAKGEMGRAVVARNEGGNRNASLRVRVAGKVSNRGGVGAKIEMRAGSLQQKLETYSASPAPAPSDVIFGLGRRESADAVRILWPSGVVQAETEFPASQGAAKSLARTLPVVELDRKPSSCPYLYVWNGERFEFVTDFMGGGELGYWAAPGVRAAPDPDEYVRIRGDQLRERGGRYELRVTNELEEALFVDRLQLVSVAHPAGVEVFPNEGLGNPTSSAFRLYATRDARPPLAASDDHGHDVLPLVSRLDRKYPDDFALKTVRGYAEPHSLTLDLGGTGAGTGQPVLLLTGWTDYAFSSDNVAAAQQGMTLSPPALQVRDGAGRWRTVVENIGIPVGRPQTVTVDLTGKFLSSSREVRILTNMRIYWDQILVGTSEARAALRVERLEASSAELRWRGFSAEVTPDGREPYGYDYARVSQTSPWKVMPGSYTRFGDVRELLTATDDMFVVSRPGDELALSFDAAPLAPLPKGWARTFLLYADGFSKEMDINSASPHEVAPMPFHGMREYPYTSPAAYPSTPAHRAYVERYNTRLVTAPPQGVASAVVLHH